MGLLVGIDPLLSAELLYLLKKAGHGDEIVIVDRNYPAEKTASKTVTGKCVEMANTDTTQATRAICSLLPLDYLVDGQAWFMCQNDGDAELSAEALDCHSAFRAALAETGNSDASVRPIRRFDFYERAERAFFVIQACGESRPYGCFILKKGVIGTDGGCPRRPPSAPTDVRVSQDVGHTVAELVGIAARQAIQARGSFTMAIAGGSLVKMLGAMAGMPGVEWAKWYVAWVDERCVPHSDKESNYGGAREAWLSKVPIPAQQVFAINEALTPGGGGMQVARKAADDYEARLKALPAGVLPRQADGLPCFDLLLLGFGPDGHMCSLFPGHALMDDESTAWILPIADSPKPPPERITLSLKAVNAASRIVVVGTGEAKADIVKQVWDPPCSLPIAQARGRAAQGPTWVLDVPAAASIQAQLRGPPQKQEVCASVPARVAQLVGEISKAAIARHGGFSIAIAGGSLVKMLGGMAEMSGVDWGKWHVAWVDERCLPHSDAESNYGGALDAWLSKVSIPKEQIYAIDESLTPGGGGMEVARRAAEDYQKRLKSMSAQALPVREDGLPAFDLLLLGFGPDGHMCSLFPGHPLLEDTSGQWILPIADSPKPPSERITFSLPAVNAASNIIVVGTGEAKADIVRQVFAPGCQLPIAKAWGRSAEGPTWLLDTPAAKLLVGR